MERKACPACNGVGYVKPGADEPPPVPLEDGKGLAPLEAEALANWLLWGKLCLRCGGSGKATERDLSK